MKMPEDTISPLLLALALMLLFVALVFQLDVDRACRTGRRPCPPVITGCGRNQRRSWHEHRRRSRTASCHFRSKPNAATYAMRLHHPYRNIPVHRAVCQLLHAGRIIKTVGESRNYRSFNFALPMLVVLIISSLVLHWGEKQVKTGTLCGRADRPRHSLF